MVMFSQKENRCMQKIEKTLKLDKKEAATVTSIRITR